MTLNLSRLLQYKDGFRLKNWAGYINLQKYSYSTQPVCSVDRTVKGLYLGCRLRPHPALDGVALSHRCFSLSLPSTLLKKKKKMNGKYLQMRIINNKKEIWLLNFLSFGDDSCKIFFKLSNTRFGRSYT